MKTKHVVAGILVIFVSANFAVMAVSRFLNLHYCFFGNLIAGILLALFALPFLYWWITKEKNLREKAEIDSADSQAGHKLAVEQIQYVNQTQEVVNILLRLSLENITLHEKLEKTLDCLLSVKWLSVESKGAIFLVEKTGGFLRMETQKGLPASLLESCARLPFGRCLCGRAALSGKPVFADNIDDRHDIKYAGMSPHGHHCVPVIFAGKVQGVINLYVKSGHIRNEKEEIFFAAVADLIAGMIQRSKVEDQLRQSQKMEVIGRLAGGIAHDFNNLLTVIMGSCTFFLQGKFPAEAGRELIEEVAAAGKRAADLTRRLLTFSRQNIVETKILNLNDVIMQMDKMIRRVIGEDIELVTVPERDLGSVKADPSQMEQVIMNLAVNARDAMANGGKLTIETGNAVLDQNYSKEHPEVPSGEYTMLAVSDTGSGMTADVQSHLFEPFFTTKEPGRGTGMGLATCYSIVKQSGGHIWVYSERDRGTTFKIYLPCVKEKSDAPDMIVKLKDLPRGQETILLVEDEATVRKLAVRILIQQGYSVVETTTPDDALRKMAEYSGGKIHLLITDVIMPKMNGKELALRFIQHCPDSKVLYMSGYTHNVILHHGTLDSGINFLQKPFTMESFACKVREVLDSRS